MGQLIEANFTPQPEALFVVSEERSALVSEFLRLCEVTLHDPAATTYLEGKHSIEKRLLHRKNRDMHLQAVRAEANGSGTPFNTSPEGLISLQKSRSVYSQLGIVEPKGTMWVGLEHHTIGSIDFTRDPFTQFILSLFRSHLD